jgi:hypothetical protein
VDETEGKDLNTSAEGTKPMVGSRVPSAEDFYNYIPRLSLGAGDRRNSPPIPHIPGYLKIFFFYLHQWIALNLSIK